MLTEQLKKILEVNYDNFTFSEIVKLKQSCFQAKSLLTHYRTYGNGNGKTQSFLYKVNGYLSLAYQAYGYINVPYSQYLKIIEQGIGRINEVLEQIDERWMLEFTCMYKTKQKFNTNVILERKYGDNTILQFISDIRNFIAAVEDFEELVSNKEHIFDVYSQALRKEIGDRESLIIQDRENLDCITFNYVNIISLKYARVKTYRITHWQIRSTETTFVPENNMNGEYSEAIENVYPEWYL